jgi:arginyl-tRNA synthetase
MLSFDLNEAKSSMNSTRIARYALKISNAFHKFYNENKVYSDDNAISNSRCYLCHKSLKILKIVLTILKIDAPEKMYK